MRISNKKECCPPQGPKIDLRPIEGDAADQEIVQLCKALAHPARARIVRLLSTKNTCICGEIVEEIGLAQSTVSQHLKVLKEVNLIYGEIEGTSVCYCLNLKVLRRFKALVAGI